MLDPFEITYRTHILYIIYIYIYIYYELILSWCTGVLYGMRHVLYTIYYITLHTKVCVRYTLLFLWILAIYYAFCAPVVYCITYAMYSALYVYIYIYIIGLRLTALCIEYSLCNIHCMYISKFIIPINIQTTCYIVQ